MSFPSIFDLSTSTPLPSYGLITAFLVDPFTLFIANLLNLPSYKDNAIGYFYHNNFYLYPCYHNKYLKILPSNLTDLLQHNYINRLTFYQLPFPETDMPLFISKLHNLTQAQKQIFIYENILLQKFQLTHYDFQSSFALFNQTLNVEPYFKILNETTLKKINTLYNKKKPISIYPNIIDDLIINRFTKLLKTFLQLFISNTHYRNIFLNYYPDNTFAEFHHNFELLLKNLDNKVLDLTDLITSYNKCRQKIQLPKFQLTEILSYENKQGLIVIHPEPIKDKYITTNSNIETLNYDELISLLLYLESMRSNDGIYDVRFTDLQNKITLELAKRRK